MHVEAFRTHEIDGKALLLLSTTMLMKYLGLKLGPALKICNIIDKLKVELRSLISICTCKFSKNLFSG